MAFSAGYSQSVTFQLDGAGGATTLKVKSASWEETVTAIETTHTGSGGIEAYIRGVLRGGASIVAGCDGAALLNAAAPGILAGAKGTLTISIGGATPWSAHVLVTKYGTPWEIDGQVMNNFDVKLDSTSGAYTRPT